MSNGAEGGEVANLNWKGERTREKKTEDRGKERVEENKQRQWEEERTTGHPPRLVLLPAQPHPDCLLHHDAGAGSVQNLVLHCETETKDCQVPANLTSEGRVMLGRICTPCCATTSEIKCVQSCSGLTPGSESWRHSVYI